MDNGTMALMIPILALMIPILAIWARHQRTIEQIRASALTEVGVQSTARSQALEERVRVLEAIITDKSYDVAAQIEALLTPSALENRSTAQ